MPDLCYIRRRRRRSFGCAKLNPFVRRFFNSGQEEAPNVDDDDATAAVLEPKSEMQCINTNTNGRTVPRGFMRENEAVSLKRPLDLCALVALAAFDFFSLSRMRHSLNIECAF